MTTEILSYLGIYQLHPHLLVLWSRRKLGITHLGHYLWHLRHMLGLNPRRLPDLGPDRHHLRRNQPRRHNLHFSYYHYHALRHRHRIRKHSRFHTHQLGFT